MIFSFLWAVLFCISSVFSLLTSGQKRKGKLIFWNKIGKLSERNFNTN